MSIVFDSLTTSEAKIKIIGVGGCGGNAIDTMTSTGIEGVEFIAVNTDKQDLANSLAIFKLQIGSKLTKGLGSGGNPEIGRSAAIEDQESLREIINGSDLLFITAGMGGGTGTGAAPYIAKLAKEKNILTIGVATLPFIYEGKIRRQQAEKGIEEFKKYVDTLIIIPNERVLDIIQDEDCCEGFKKVDQIIVEAVRGVSDLINKPGHMNLDFADIKSSIAKNKGVEALVGTGFSFGENKVKNAIKEAVKSPFLENLNIYDAKNIIINVTISNRNTQMTEVISGLSYLKEVSNPNADIKTGVVFDESLGSEAKVTIFAVGFKRDSYTDSLEENKNVDEDLLISINKKDERLDDFDNQPFVSEDIINIPSFLRKRN
jgi:cell division protein FtsZ